MSVIICGMKIPENCAQCKKAKLQLWIGCKEHEWLSNGLQTEHRSPTCPMTEVPGDAETNLFDVVEEHANCHVQVLRNSITGEISVGWWEEKE